MSTTTTPSPASTESSANWRNGASTVALRAAGYALVLYFVATLTFFAIRLIPGDPVDALLGNSDSASSELKEQLRIEHGFDRPIIVQYFDFLGGLFTGDLGESYQMRQPVSELLGELVGSTIVLAVAALAVAWLIAIGLALWSVHGSRGSTVVGQTLEIAAAAVPHFWLGTILILVFSVNFGILPSTSGENTGPAGLILPVLTLAVPLAGFLGQTMREALMNAMSSPFALSARARGESEVGVALRHALRHGALPGIGLSGWAFGSLISGAVVVETLFSRPGLGRSLLQSVLARDVPLIIGIVLLVALLYIVVLIIVDVVERIADPRLRSA